MALLDHTPNKFLPNSLIETAHSVKPTKATDRKFSRLVKISNAVSSGVLQSRLNVVLYYDRQASGGDAVKFLAGWIVESLGKALEDHPVFAGRLRRGVEGEVEVVPNDSGVRLLEARIPINVEEFLDSSAKEGAEAELVFWSDIDEENLEYTPLFYVQVTKFSCGGCSIGISCSLLLANPLIFMSFLRKWSTIHNKVVSETRQPVFYVPNLNPKDNTCLFKKIESPPLTNRGKTMIFKRNTRSDDDETVALQCIEEAEALQLGDKVVPKSYFVVKETYQGVEVEKFTREMINSGKPLSYGSEFSAVWEEEIEAMEASFFGGNKACGVSYWNSSESSDGLVMMMNPSTDPDEGVSEFNVVVTIP